MAQSPRRQQPQHPAVIDPDNVPEIICNGRFTLHSHGNLATLTFTNVRPDAANLFGGTMTNKEVVRARITMTKDNMVALRDLLTRNHSDARSTHGCRRWPRWHEALNCPCANLSFAFRFARESLEFQLGLRAMLPLGHHVNGALEAPPMRRDVQDQLSSDRISPCLKTASRPNHQAWPHHSKEYIDLYKQTTQLIGQPVADWAQLEDHLAVARSA